MEMLLHYSSQSVMTSNYIPNIWYENLYTTMPFWYQRSCPFFVTILVFIGVWEFHRNIAMKLI